MIAAQNNKTERISQIELAIGLLRDMGPDISDEDKKEATRELKMSMRTIQYYMKGERKDLDTATRLVEFFKERIKKRGKILRPN